MRATSCTACLSPTRTLGRREGYTYDYCPACGTVQLSEVPAPEVLEAAYRDEYHLRDHYCSDAALHDQQRARVADQIASLVAGLHSRDDRRLVVEIGAGWGSLARRLSTLDIPYLGIEPSRAMSAFARERGLNVIHGGMNALSGLIENRGVRTIVLAAVFEHLADQSGALIQMRDALPSDGAIVIQSPTAGLPRLIGRTMRWFAPGAELPAVFGSLAPPWHICLPSPRGIRIQANRNDLTVETIIPSLSGRKRDWTSILQIVNELVATAGWHVVGERWPAVMAHIFVLRRRQRDSGPMV